MKTPTPPHKLARILVGDVIDSRHRFKGMMPGQGTEGARPYYGGGRSGVDVIPSAPPRASARFTNATRGDTPNRSKFQELLNRVQQDQKDFDNGG